MKVFELFPKEKNLKNIISRLKITKTLIMCQKYTLRTNELILMVSPWLFPAKYTSFAHSFVIQRIAYFQKLLL
jgi:hypothetical protein